MSKVLLTMQDNRGQLWIVAGELALLARSLRPNTSPITMEDLEKYDPKLIQIQVVNDDGSHTDQALRQTPEARPARVEAGQGLQEVVPGADQHSANP